MTHFLMTRPLTHTYFSMTHSHDSLASYDSLRFLVTHSTSYNSFTSFMTHPLINSLLITYSLLTDPLLMLTNPLLHTYSFAYIAQLAHVFKEDTSDGWNLRSVLVTIPVINSVILTTLHSIPPKSLRVVIPLDILLKPPFQKASLSTALPSLLYPRHSILKDRHL